MTPTMPAQQLSDHFSLSEFIRSSVAAKRNIDNTAPPNVLKNLRSLAQFCERVRQELNHAPMLISSGYRCSELNRAVGGAVNSSHLVGLACDFTAPDFGTPFAIGKKLAHSTLLFDQLIMERSQLAVWVHIGIADEDHPPRRQLLTMDSNGIRSGLWE